MRGRRVGPYGAALVLCSLVALLAQLPQPTAAHKQVPVSIDAFGEADTQQDERVDAGQRQRERRRLAPIKGASVTSNLCDKAADQCKEDAECNECILLGSITSDAESPFKCADARGAFFNSYNGSTSANRNLECNPYNTNSALGEYLDCVWKSGPCGVFSSAAAVRAGALSLAGIVVAMLLVN